MLQVFETESVNYSKSKYKPPSASFNFLIQKFSIEGHISYFDVLNSEVKSLKSHRLRLILMVSPLVIDISPFLIKDLQ